MRKPTKQTLRNKADKVLQNYIRAAHPELCWVCGEMPISCGHHFIYISQSNATRYYLPNLIPICRECHYLIHKQPSLGNGKITLKMGEEWLKDIEEVKRRGQKFTKEWVETNLNILHSLLTQLERER